MIVELETRVVEVTYTPGPEVPGVCRRTVWIEVLSGEPFTEEEFNRIIAGMVADALEAGGEITGWDSGE